MISAVERPSDINPKQQKKLSSFSVILIMAALMVVGVGMIPLLNVQYAPQIKQTRLSVNYSWYGASARLVEAEVTSKIEGVLATIRGIEKMESVSEKGGGSITLTFKKGTNIDAARFEAATLIKQIYNKFPEGVTYPVFSTGVSGTARSTLLSYTINSPLPTSQIEQYAEDNILAPLSEIDGVNEAALTGATNYEWVITFEPELCRKLGVHPDEIQSAVNNQFTVSQMGLANEYMADGEIQQLRVLVSNKTENYSPEDYDWESIIVKNAEGRIITLGDVAVVQYKEAPPTRYFRINGRNNINLTIYADEKINTLEVAAEVKAKMKEIQEAAGGDFSFIIASDDTIRIKEDLNKIYLRTVMSLLILLGFVYLVSRNVRYLLIIVLTMTANILTAFIFYYIFKVDLHLYSLAGITVSLGLIIDTSIIMIDHYSYYHNRKAFIAVLAALLTTIGSLAIVFFLPEDQKADLVDFSAVLIINLTVSLVIAVLFIPALLEKLPVERRQGVKQISFRRRLSRFTGYYRGFIVWNKRHKWILITLLILGFGIPVQLLPEKIKDKENTNQDATGFFPELYNKTFGSTVYREKIKPIAEPALGGSMRLFAKEMTGSSFRMPTRTSVYIGAAMPEGCTIHQLNELVLKMENFLSRYDEIDTYTTNVTSYRNGFINVYFKKSAEGTGFPIFLVDAAIAEAQNLGGADWRVYGEGQSFHNAVNTQYKGSQISLTGYNYEQLYEYAEVLVDTLLNNRRVEEPGIYAGDTYSVPMTEYYMDFDFEQFTLSGIPLIQYYDYLRTKLYDRSLPPVFNGKEMQQVRLVSGEGSSFDVWSLENNIVSIGDNDMKLSEFGSIAKRRTGNNIYKTDQQYVLLVAYDFIGASELNNKVINRVTDDLNETLPLGYKAENNTSRWNWFQNKTPYYLLFLIIAIIYFICAILFESLIQPFVIIMMIPISFIGVFLTFSLFNFTFDQGGFASFVLLSGIVVNAGIYIINEYNLICRGSGRASLKNYLKAYNHKIVPITLTVISTVLGLIPFVYDGKDEVFWFSFAVGAMGGMIFSIVALIIYLPVFTPVGEHFRRPSKRRVRLKSRD